MRASWMRILLSFVVGILALVALPLSAYAIADVELLEVTGILERIEPGADGTEVVTLNVHGREASGPMASDCRFTDERGQLVEKKEFLRQYRKRVVTLELEAKSGAAVSCRLGS